MYITRSIEPTLRRALKLFPVVLLTGPRRSGKTTLLRHVLGMQYNYVSLDEAETRLLASSDPQTFFIRYPAPLIIDEIQNAPQLFSYIKARVDKDKKPGQWVLTGSQQFPLMRNVSESLAGRVAVLSLFSFGISELRRDIGNGPKDAAAFIHALSKQEGPLPRSPELGAWLLKGGYPEVVLQKKMPSALWFSGYLQTYIDRDVRGNIRSSNLNDFERFIRLLASRTSQELHCASLSRDLGITIPTVKSWLSFLEASSLVFFLNPYHKNFGKRIIKTPKCYFLDTGLAAYLVGLQDEKHLLQGPMAGALFETACLTQFVRRFKAIADPCNLFFWKSVDGYEVDLLVETAQGIFPIEFKLSATVSAQHAGSLKKWMQLAGDLSNDGLIVSSSCSTGPIASGVHSAHFSGL